MEQGRIHCQAETTSQAIAKLSDGCVSAFKAIQNTRQVFFQAAIGNHSTSSISSHEYDVMNVIQLIIMLTCRFLSINKIIRCHNISS